MQYGFCDMFWSFGFKGRELNSYFLFSCFVYDIQLAIIIMYYVVPLIEDAISSLHATTCPPPPLALLVPTSYTQLQNYSLNVREDFWSKLALDHHFCKTIFS